MTAWALNITLALTWTLIPLAAFAGALWLVTGMSFDLGEMKREGLNGAVQYTARMLRRKYAWTAAAQFLFFLVGMQRVAALIATPDNGEPAALTASVVISLLLTMGEGAIIMGTVTLDQLRRGVERIRRQDERIKYGRRLEDAEGSP